MKITRGEILNDNDRLNSVCKECGTYITVGETVIIEHNGGERKHHEQCFKKVRNRRADCDYRKPNRLFGRVFTD